MRCFVSLYCIIRRVLRVLRAGGGDAALARGRAGITSPLEYHMFAKRMDMATLTSATGYGAWRVKRHLKPHIFNKLTDAKLKPYCEAMDILPEELRRLPVQEPGESPEVPAESKA